MRRIAQHFLPVIFAMAAASSRAADPLPDFHLDDTNPQSPRFDAKVSPRDYILQVSGYYFGHAS
jgi:hypothetical protein